MYRLSFFGAIHLAQGRLVWNDALGHKQFPLSQAELRIIGTYSHALYNVSDLNSGEDSVVANLIDCNVLVESGSERACVEEDLMSQWQGWGTFTRLYHFSTRTTADSPFLDEQHDTERLKSKYELFRPPRRWASSENVSREQIILLPKPKRVVRDYVDVLECRKTPSRIVGPAVSLGDLSTILKLSAGLDERNNETEAAIGNYYRCAPSGGARASVELFLCARDVGGLEEGCYWYLADVHGLIRVADSPDSSVLRASLRQQKRFTGAPLFVAVAGNLEALMWKYQTGRTYRDLFWDAGHVGQILQMTASALGLASAFTIVQDDQTWENVLNFGPADMPVLGVYAVGTGLD